MIIHMIKKHMETETENEINKDKVMINGIEILKSDYFINLLPINSKQSFIESWVEWVDYRKEIRKKITKSSASKQIIFLLKQPDPSACITQSIEKGWQGLFAIGDIANVLSYDKRVKYLDFTK